MLIRAISSVWLERSADSLTARERVISKPKGPWFESAMAHHSSTFKIYHHEIGYSNC